MKDKEFANNLFITDQLCFTIYETHRVFNKFYQISLEKFALTYPQYVVLAILWKKKSISLKELGNILFLKSNTLSPLLKRLEDNDWIIREQPSNDKRQLIIHLSQKAIDNQKEILENLRTCVGTVSEKDIEEHNKALETLKNINKKFKKLLKKSQ